MAYQHIADQAHLYPKRANNTKHFSDNDSFSSSSAIPLHDFYAPEQHLDGSEPPSKLPVDWREPITSKILLIVACLLPLIPSLWLLARSSSHAYTPTILHFVVENRATTQIIISVLSIVLATLNVFVCTRLLNFRTRIALSRQTISLNGLNWLRSVSTQKVAPGLPFWLRISAYVLVVLFAVPAFLWTGSLTPVITTASPKIWDETILIPDYNAGSATYWANKTALYAKDCVTYGSSKAQLSSCPAEKLSSALLLSASQATLWKNNTIAHPKNDASRYSYLGRSYGVGVSAGLVDEKFIDAGVLTYNYTEYGYSTKVTCSYNTSTSWGLELVQPGDAEHGIPYIYFTYGYFPNTAADGGPDFFAVPALFNDDNVVVLGSKANSSRNIILIAAGQDYLVLNATQCEAFFVPTRFQVVVSTVQRTIAVTPQQPDNFLDTPGLSNSAMQQLGTLSLINTSLYISVLGASLMTNIAFNQIVDNGTAAVFSAIGDSFTAILDDLLASMAAVQLLVANDTSSARTTVSQTYVVLGDIKYIIAILIINVLLVLLTIAEGIRTAFWKQLPFFDYTNTKSLVIASAIAGNEIVVGTLRERSIVKQAWTGSSDESNYEDEGEIRLRLMKIDVDVDGTHIPAAAFSATRKMPFT